MKTLSLICLLLWLTPCAAGQTQAQTQGAQTPANGTGQPTERAAGTTQQGRALIGRITALKPETKEIVILARMPGGQTQQVTISAAAPEVRVLRLAPDSLSLKDATPSSFADLRVGDQLGVTGERSADGARVMATQIVSGSVVRVGGTVAKVNASANELTINLQPNKQSLTIAIGPRSTLRRIPPDVAASLVKERERARDARRASDQRAQGSQSSADNRTTNNSAPDTAPPRRDGQTRQELFRSLPTVALTDLKPGDAVLVMATPSNDPTRVTAISLLTGEADLLTRLQQQPAGRDRQNDNPGLPGDVLGGGTAPQTTTNPHDQTSPPPP